jgi:hypothetical protein
MKTYIQAVLVLGLLSCSKPEKTSVKTVQNNDVRQVQPDLFKHDSIMVEDSLKVDENLTISFKSSILVFPNIADKTLLDSIYAKEQIKLSEYSAENLQKELNSKKEKYFANSKASLQEWKPDFKQTWNQHSDMKLFSEMNDLMTVQYSGDGYTGGAHGYYYEFYKVFDAKNNTTLQLSDVVQNRDPKIWGKILMDNYLSSESGRAQPNMLLVKEIPLTRNFYFDSNNLYFLYNEYEIAAYASGPVLLKVPFSGIREMLNPDFRSKMNIQ